MTGQEPGRKPGRIIDVDGAVDVGEGFALAYTIGPDGDRWPILYDSRQHQEQAMPSRPAAFREVAPHELTGQLPPEFRQFWCGAQTHSGKPCRRSVRRRGDRCRQHKLTVTETAPPQPPSAAAGIVDEPLFAWPGDQP